MLNRRNFLKGAAVAGGLMVLPSWSIAKTPGPNSKLRVAVVGVGGRGDAVISAFRNSPHVEFAAFCDVDDTMAAKTYKEFPTVPRFRDFRVMLDKMDKQIDAVTVATPDHMHYPIAAWAIAKGKHVYCEKPLTRTIWEANELKRLADKAGVITQMGNQGHTNEGWRVIKEWYEAGIIGQIEDIYIWTNRPIWPQGQLKMPKGQPVPSTLDYKLWLGVAPYQPYSKEILPFNWRGLRNYGTGAAGDMACHFLDVPYSAFDLGYPMSIVANSTPFNDCGRRPKEIKRVDPEFLKPDPKNPWNRANCTFIVGTKETVYTNEYGSETYIYPRPRMKEVAKSGALPKKTIARSTNPGNPHMEWAMACLAGKQPMGNFNYAAPFTEMALLGMIGIIFPERELNYVPSTLSFANCPEADKYVKSLYAYDKEFLPSK